MSRLHNFICKGLPLPLVVLGSQLFGETVRLKNGTVVNGSIVQMTETEVTLDTADMGQVLLKRRAIATIEDGVSVTGPSQSAVTTAPSGSNAQGQPMIVNNNNNNNNLLATPAATAVPVQPTTEPQTQPSSATVASAAPAVMPTVQPTANVEAQVLPRSGSSQDYFGASVSYGYGLLTVTGRDAILTDTLRVVPYFYRWNSGFYADVFAEGARGRDDLTLEKLIKGGMSLGWATEAPNIGESGFMFSTGVSGSYAELQSQSQVDPYYGNYYGAPQSRDSKSNAFMVGASASLSYFFSGGAGLTIAANMAKNPANTTARANSESQYPIPSYEKVQTENAESPDLSSVETGEYSSSPAMMSSGGFALSEEEIYGPDENIDAFMSITAGIAFRF